MPKDPCSVLAETVNFESDLGKNPAVSQLKYGVYDPKKRRHGSLAWHKPFGKQESSPFAEMDL